MSGKAFVALAVATSFNMLAIVSAVSAGDQGERGREKGVLPCSLDGVNPVYHPEIFASPAAARSFGFVRGPDRVWRVVPGCPR